MIKAVHHITINVKNLPESIRFYGTFLGLEQLEGADMGDHRLHYFQLPGGARLELIEYLENTGICQAGLLEQGRFRHLALETDELKYIEEHIEEFGGKVLQPPRFVKELLFTGMLAEDPNGCELEFVSPASPGQEKKYGTE